MDDGACYWTPTSSGYAERQMYGISVVGQHTRGKKKGWSRGEQTAQGGNVKECNMCKGNVRQERGEEEEDGMDENGGRAKEGRTKGDRAGEEECEKSRG